MNTNLERAKEIFATDEYTCVLVKDDVCYHSFERGVKPLLNWVKEKKNFTGFSAVDKVVGKAAAFLYALLKIECVYAKTISKPALEVLKEHKINVEYDVLTDAIINRAGTGFCPMETAVRDIFDKEKALEAICKKTEELQKQRENK